MTAVVGDLVEASSSYTATAHQGCGVELRGLDFGAATDRDISDVHAKLAEFGVVFFRDSGSSPGECITPVEQAQFAHQIGEVNINRFFAHIEGHPEIAKVEKTREATNAIGAGFHADHTYDLAPALGSLLVAQEVPSTGGNTAFVDMHKAYETLPAELKKQIAGMRAVHSSRHVFGVNGVQVRQDLYAYLGYNFGMVCMFWCVQANADKSFTNREAAVQDTVHPVVIRHPVSGKKVLFVNPGFTIHFEGQTPEESFPLLSALYDHALQPEHMSQFSHAPGTAVLWDNRAVWHCALNDYPGQYRLMHRITIEGSTLEPAHADLCAASAPLPADEERIDMLKLKWGQTPLELPFLHHVMTTTKVGMERLDPEMDRWWMEDPPWYAQLVMKSFSYAGLDLMKMASMMMSRKSRL